MITRLVGVHARGGDGPASTKPPSGPYASPPAAATAPAQMSGTITGSMPIRLKWMCQRMTARLAAARSGKAAESLRG